MHKNNNNTSRRRLHWWLVGVCQHVVYELSGGAVEAYLTRAAHCLAQLIVLIGRVARERVGELGVDLVVGGRVVEQLLEVVDVGRTDLPE